MSNPATPSKVTNSDEYASHPQASLLVRAYLAALGRLGGKRTSDAKRRAARRNGKQHRRRGED